MQHVEVARADPPAPRASRTSRSSARRLVLLDDAALGVAARELRRDRCRPRSRRSGRPRPDTSAPTPPRDTATMRLGIEAERRLQPVQERHPVQRLEADLRQPRPDDEQPAARDDRLDLALDAPLGAVEAPAAPAAALCRRDAARTGRRTRAVQRLDGVDAASRTASAACAASRAIASLTPSVADLDGPADAVGQPRAARCLRRQVAARPASDQCFTGRLRPSAAGAAEPEPERRRSRAGRARRTCRSAAPRTRAWPPRGDRSGSPLGCE